MKSNGFSHLVTFSAVMAAFSARSKNCDRPVIAYIALFLTAIDQAVYPLLLTKAAHKFKAMNTAMTGAMTLFYQEN